ncbi:hypothetical protein O3P69_006607 [Scylla paramamosain]|uniref:Uncharacterized protein n=1 Tax=Scylla paramamosain TaxID=85552 RepID=A0AAW0U3E2_SCYPA
MIVKTAENGIYSHLINPEAVSSGCPLGCDSNIRSSSCLSAIKARNTSIVSSTTVQPSQDRLRHRATNDITGREVQGWRVDTGRTLINSSSLATTRLLQVFPALVTGV